MNEPWFGPAEIAERLGISVKALRVYERKGLIRPVRTAAGYRAYGTEQEARLHQILALKQFGFSLQRIGQLLAVGSTGLGAVLELQQQMLQARRSEADHALSLIDAARKTLAREGRLPPDDIVRLTRETVMYDKSKTPEEWRAAFAPILAKHYTPERREELIKLKRQAYAVAGYDEPSFSAAWRAMFEEARALTAANDASSPRACALARRWIEMISYFTRGDAEIERKERAIWEEAMSDPTVADKIPISSEEFAFVQKIADGMRARGELPLRA
jgi:DNA-binding transcriptional MerR regulator